MPLADKVHKFIEKESLFDQSSKLLVAVSGGIDSMCLLQFLYANNYEVSVAHINYRLRDGESEQDQQLVESYCQSKGISCYVYELTSAQVGSLKKGNLQEKDRNIRYGFFNKVIREQQLDHLCVAYHGDDQIETMLINMTRGANLTGLTAMHAQIDHVRRPFLCIAKGDIVDYARQNQVPYRLDQSNLRSDYERNFIRNEILDPLYSEISRSKNGLRTTLSFLEEDKRFRDYYMAQERSNYVTENGKFTAINSLSLLSEHATPGLLLFCLIKDFGFNKSQAELILERQGEEERYFNSATHEAVVKKDQLLIRAISTVDSVELLIEDLGSYDLGSGVLTLSPADNVQYSSDSNIEIASIDFSHGPLVVRNWSTGDRFSPFGMKGQTKKLSDFFGDLKLHRFEKENVKVLTQRDQIIWVVGYRLSHDFRVVDRIPPVRLSYESVRM